MSETIILSFKPISATLQTRFCKDGLNAPSIVYDLKNENPLQRIVSIEGVGLSNLDWSIRVLAAEKYNEKIDNIGGIGIMRNSDSMTCYITAIVGIKMFEYLCNNKFLPDVINIHARGLNYSDNGGHKIVWSKPAEGAVVSEVEFTLPLVESKKPGVEGAGAAIDPALALARRTNILLYVIAIAAVLNGLKLYLG